MLKIHPVTFFSVSRWETPSETELLWLFVSVSGVYHCGRRHQAQLGSHGSPDSSVLLHNYWWSNVFYYWSGVLLLTGKNIYAFSHENDDIGLCLSLIIVLFSLFWAKVIFCVFKAPSNMKAVLQAGWLLTVAVGNFIVLIVAELAKLPKQVKQTTTTNKRKD